MTIAAGHPRLDDTFEDIEESTNLVRQAFDVLLAPGSVAELRVLKTRQKTVSGYYNDFDKLATDAIEWSGFAPGVYITLNPTLPDLLARKYNRCEGYAERTTTDDQILRQRWVPLDFDPV